MSTYQQGQPIEITDTFTLDGVETDPTQVVYSILAPNGTLTTYTWPGAVEIAHPSVGNLVLSLSPPTLPGTYHYDVDATGAVVASRAANFTVLANVASAVDLDWAVVGPCSPWADSQDVWNCCGQPMVTIGEGSMATECAVDMSQMAMAASQILWELSGRQFSGVCEKNGVRPPCGCGCWSQQVLSRGHIVWNPMAGYWNCGGQNFGCCGVSRVKLSGYPVREVTEVKIDGVVLDPSEYRLDERRYLTRTDSGRWPSCHNITLPDSEEGTFSISYSYGQDPPIIGQMAAAQLGCEIYKACAGGGSAADCILPSGVTRIVRQGITIERNAFATWAFQERAWRTGLTLVDAFLGTYNRFGLSRRPSVWSPLSQSYARSVGQ